MRVLAQRLTTPYGSRASSGAVIGRGTAAVSIAAGLLHVSAAVQHRDLPTMMVGFEIVAVLQVGLGAVLILGRPSRPLLAGGIALMASAVVLWLISRTAGLGFLVEGTHSEPIGFKDGVAVLFELLAIGGLVTLVEPRLGLPGLPGSWLTVRPLGLAGAAALVLFVPALLAGGHDHVAIHAASVHGSGGQAPHLPAGHPNGSRGERGHEPRHADRSGTGHGREHADSHASHPAGSAPTHAHGSELAVAPVHDHALASTPGVVAGSSHAHTGSGTTTGSAHPAGGADHGTHPPGHDSGYGGSGGEPPAPPPEEPAPVLGDPAEEVDKLVP